MLFLSALLLVCLSLGIVCVEVILSTIPETAPSILLTFTGADDGPPTLVLAPRATPYDAADLPVACPPAVQLLLTFGDDTDIPLSCPPPVALLLLWDACEASEGTNSPAAPLAPVVTTDGSVYRGGVPVRLSDCLASEPHAALTWTVVAGVNPRRALVAIVRELAADVAPGRSFHTKTTKQPTKGLRRFITTHADDVWFSASRP